MDAPAIRSQTHDVRLSERAAHLRRRAACGVATIAAMVCLCGMAMPSPANAQVSGPLAPGHVTVAPGKVRFSQTRDGRWVELTPLWLTGRSLIESGGFAIYARDETGRLIELMRTGGDNVTPSFLAGEGVKYSEGTPRGFRAPSLDADDDHDGTDDEDPLDGIDNDHDGSVDEDFAAIGDEMVVMAYSARGESPAFAVDCHQETYAWSLPSIDGAVMMTLSVRNVGPSALTDVHVVAYYKKAGAFDVFEDAIQPPLMTGRSPARSAIAAEPGGGALALITFPSATDGAWLAGYAESPDGMEESVRQTLAVGAMGPDDTQSAETRVGGVQMGATVFCVSPTIGWLAPGQVVEVAVAIATTQRREDISEVAATAFQTYAGDGVNRFVPPPMSVRPRVLWGTYRVDPPDGAVIVAIENWDDNPVRADDISYFSGVDRPAVTTRRQPGGETELILEGRIADELRGQRETLKGRLNTGEFFELNLRPDMEVGVSRPREVEAFWKIPGKLSGDVLHGSPTPFRNSTSIFYEIPAVTEQEDGTILRSTGPYDTSVKIYNVSGRLVDVLVEGNLFPGTYSIDWSATDDHGNTVASGVYYVKLQVEKRSITKRLILLK